MPKANLNVSLITVQHIFPNLFPFALSTHQFQFGTIKSLFRKGGCFMRVLRNTIPGVSYPSFILKESSHVASKVSQRDARIRSGTGSG